MIDSYSYECILYPCRKHVVKHIDLVRSTVWQKNNDFYIVI